MLRVRDAKSGGTSLEPIKTGHSWVFQVSYSPDNTKIATCGTGEGRVRIWNSKTGELLFKEYDDSDLIVVLQGVGSAPGLAWMSDGKKLIYASRSSMSRNSSSLSIMDTAARKDIADIEGCKGTVQAISLSSNGRILASGSDDCTARLWNLDTNLQIGLPLRHEIQVQCIALSGDGKILVTACQDKIVYVWDMHTILEEAGLDSGLLSIRNWLGVYHRFRLGATVLVNHLSSLFRPS
jgi:WD40 repeat protein